jgi:hypothetical protein
MEGNMDQNLSEWITVSEAMELLRARGWAVTRQNINKHRHNGRFGHIKKGNTYLVHKRQLLDFMESVSPRGTPRKKIKGKEVDRGKGTITGVFRADEKKPLEIRSIANEERRQKLLEAAYAWVPSPSDRDLLIELTKRQFAMPELSRRKSKLLQLALDNLGVLYYNLDVSDKEQLDSFLDHHYEFYRRSQNIERIRDELGVDAEILDEIEESRSRTLESLKELSRDFVRSDQPIYKAIIDKIMRREEFSKAELGHMLDRIAGTLSQCRQSSDDEGWWILRSYGIEILHMIYEWVIDLTRGEVKFRRCALEECECIFIPGSGRYPKQYCSPAHRMKAFRRRKKKEAVSG